MSHYLKYIIILAVLLIPNISSAYTCGMTTSGGDRAWATAATWFDCGGGVPGTNDDVIATSTSGASTIAANITVKSLDMTGYANTLTHNASVTLTISGGAGSVFKLASGMTYNVPATSAAINFTGTTATTTITTAGKLLPDTTFDGVGGGWKLLDSINTSKGSNGGILSLTKGSLDTNGQTIIVGYFYSSNSNTRLITLGASNITVSITWNFNINSNLTFYADTSTITLGGANFYGGGKTYNNVIFTKDGGLQITQANTFANLTRNGSAVKTETITLNNNQTITNTFTVNGASSTSRVLITSGTLGTPYTINAANVSVSNVDFRDIIGAGAGNWNLAAITGLSGDAGGNSGITFTTATTTYWVHGSTASENWSDSSNWAWGSGLAGGTGRVPLPQDDVRFDANSFGATGKTVTLDMPRAARNIDWTGATNNPTWTFSVANSIYGSLTLISGMTFNSNYQLTYFSGRAAGMPVGGWTLTSAGKNFLSQIDIFMVGGTLTLQDAFSQSYSRFYIEYGTLDANDFNVTVVTGQFTTGTIIMGSGTWTANGDGNVWNVTSGFTVTPETSTVIISNTTAVGKTFIGGSKTYNNVIFSGDNIGVEGANTFNTMAVNNGGLANGLILPTGVSTTTVTNLTTNANSTGSRAIIKSATAGTIAGLKTTLSSNICVDYMSIQDINAYSTGSGKFFAGLHSLNVSGNNGWVWSVGCGNPNYGTRTSSSTPNVKITSSAAAAGAPGWYGAGWNYRKKISINYRKVATTTGPNITNFPMLVSVTDSNLKFTSNGGKVASSTGGDIVFTSGNGTTALNYEIEKYASTTGELVAWVQIPFLSSTSTTPIYMYLGNASAPDVPASTAQNTWDANFKGVWHLPNGTSLTANDSTSNANNFTTIGSGATATSGKSDGAASFLNNDPIYNGYLNRVGFNNPPSSYMTLCTWVKTTSASRHLFTINRDMDNYANEGGLDIDANKKMFFWDYRGPYGFQTISNNTVVSDNTWHYICFVKSTTNGTYYFDGVNDGVTTAAVDVAYGNGYSYTIGGDMRSGAVPGSLNGVVDEFRISATARSADWILTEYRNQSSPSSFYGYGGLETQTGRVDNSGAVVPVMKIKGGVKFR